MNLSGQLFHIILANDDEAICLLSACKKAHFVKAYRKYVKALRLKRIVCDPRSCTSNLFRFKYEIIA